MKQRYTRLAALCLAWLFAINASAFVTDTIRHRIKSRYPVEFSSEVEERPTDYLTNDGQPIIKQVHTTYAVYNDTVRTIVIERDSIYLNKNSHQLADTLNVAGGNRFHLSIGGGYGSLGYSLPDRGTVNGSLKALIQIEYAYFFTDDWGFGIGLNFSNLTSMVDLYGSKTWNGITDSDGENYNHTVDILGWREKETVHRLSVPVSVQMQHYFGKKKAVGIYADLGASADVFLLSNYNVLQGQVEDRAFYPSTNLSLRHAHEFGVRDMVSKGKMRVTPAGLGVFADLGLLIKVNDNTALSIGAYAHYTPTDINRSIRSEMGFGNSTFTFMPEYQGAFATTEATKARPWEAGLKLGIRLNAGDRRLTQAEKDNLEKKAWERRDTTDVITIRKERLEEHENKAYTQLPTKEQSSVNITPLPIDPSEIATEDEITTEEKIAAEDYQETLTEPANITTTPTEPAAAPTIVQPQKTKSASAAPAKKAKKYRYHLLYFALDRTDLNASVQQHLQQIARTLIDNPDKHVIVSGYACELGSKQYNMQISEQRAQNVADYLISLGVDESRIQTKAYGNTHAQQTNRKQMWKDRRVVVKVSE